MAGSRSKLRLQSTPAAAAAYSTGAADSAHPMCIGVHRAVTAAAAAALAEPAALQLDLAPARAFPLETDEL